MAAAKILARKGRLDTGINYILWGPAEIWQLLSTTPENFKGVGVWMVI